MNTSRVISVRPARASDWRLLRDLRLRALADAPDAFGETFAHARTLEDRDWIARASFDPTVYRLIAERDGAPVGMTVAVLDRVDHGLAHLYAMWVAPDARRAGAGSALVRAALAWARQRAALTVELRVSDTRPDARALYTACGFKLAGQRSPLRDGAATDCESMTIRLLPLVMGVVNVTPDSFSDGGSYFDAGRAIAHGLELRAQGADILDIGGEATNPRAKAVDAHEELRRVMPVIEGLAAAGLATPDILPVERVDDETDELPWVRRARAAHPTALAGGCRLSIDTTKAEVARAAVRAGASIINDVSGGLFDPAMVTAAAELGATYIVGHLRGQSLAAVFAAEGTVPWTDVARELKERKAADRLAAALVGRLWVDPGIGFGKGADPDGNVQLIRHAGELGRAVGCPVVIGASRKRFLRRLLGADQVDAGALDAASVLASLAAMRAGAHVLRVHNVTLLHTHLTAYNKN